MRHRHTTPKLGRTPAHRKAMLRNMVTDFFKHEKIRTTQAKAKALRPYAERLITLGKKDTLTSRRQAARFVRDKAVLKKLFDELAPRYSERPGGYTRIIKLTSRAGDNAQMAIIEMVEAEMPERKKRKKPEYAGPLKDAADLRAKVEVVEEVDDEMEASVEETVEDVESAADDVAEQVEDAAQEAPEQAAEEPAEEVAEEAAEADALDAESVADDAASDEDEEKTE